MLEREPESALQRSKKLILGDICEALAVRGVRSVLLIVCFARKTSRTL